MSNYVKVRTEQGMTGSDQVRSVQVKSRSAHIISVQGQVKSISDYFR